MRAKMIRVSFNVQMAKDITNGDKEGRIITKDGKAVRIICWDKKSSLHIVALIDCGDNTEYTEHYYNDGVALHPTDEENSANLMLEVPEYTQFKKGDVIVFGCNKNKLNIGIFRGKRYVDSHYDYAVLADNYIHFDAGNWVYDNSRFATEEEKQKFIDALKKSTDPRAKDCLKILGIEEKPKCEFKPFDKVLGRDDNDNVWRADIFSHIDNDEMYPFKCVGFEWRYCIPYEGNESLLGTTNNINE